jgi:hypothetical protein
VASPGKASSRDGELWSTLSHSEIAKGVPGSDQARDRTRSRGVSRTDADTDVSLRSGLLRDPLAKSSRLFDTRVFGVEASAELKGVRIGRAAELARDRPSSKRLELALSGRRNRLGAIQSIGTCDAPEAESSVVFGVFGVCASERLRTGDASTAGPRVCDWAVDVESSCTEENTDSALLRALRMWSEAARCRTTICRVGAFEIRGSIYRYGGKPFQVDSGGCSAYSAPKRRVPVGPIQRRFRTRRFG